MLQGTAEAWSSVQLPPLRAWSRAYSISTCPTYRCRLQTRGSRTRLCGAGNPRPDRRDDLNSSWFLTLIINAARACALGGLGAGVLGDSGAHRRCQGGYSVDQNTPGTIDSHPRGGKGSVFGHLGPKCERARHRGRY